MAFGVEVLRFQLPGHEAATLRNMNQLRSEERFCDVTVVSDTLKFRGHKVILAACSPFLRDQFLLNPTSELQVSLMHSTKIVADLLLSCYTGTLEFAVRDIVNYLTAASYLQMEHVVVKCRNALHQYIEPKMYLKEEGIGGSSKRGRSKSFGGGTAKSRGGIHSRSSQTITKADLPPQETLEMKVEGSEDEEEDDNDEEPEDDSASDYCLVKVESAMEQTHRKKRKQKPQPRWAKEDSREQEDSQVNSTVEGLNLELERSQQGAVKACYNFPEDMEGDGLMIIPSGYYEEREAATSSGECESSMAGIMGYGGRAFSSSTMKDILRMGNPLRNIKCAKCEEVFQGVEKLVFHMRAQHFIFMCPRCGKQFNHSSNLNRHMNVHRGVKSHTCLICGKCFTQKSTLHDHMNLHSGARPYHCSYCNVRFAHKPAIRRHLKEQHGKTTAENVMEASVTEINLLGGYNERDEGGDLGYNERDDGPDLGYAEREEVPLPGYAELEEGPVPSYSKQDEESEPAPQDLGQGEGTGKMD
ncbi:zinc finger and BTB domain-containing protein 12-like [Pleurodeles waltl]|uniref:zinc finger and BTB domain-containing protein 12-like n=1 Tax=Pleurodeles waltl TaxID=8319 RepID=UPI003709AB47